MPYFIHWIWFAAKSSGPTKPPANILANIKAWCERFAETQFVPVLWVNAPVFAWARSIPTTSKVEKIPEFEGRNYLVVTIDTSKARLIVIDTDALSVRAYYATRIPTFELLCAVMDSELDESGGSGYFQVASDVWRIVALAEHSGAYWDLGDTAPGSEPWQQVFTRSIQEDMPPVIPQVLMSNSGREVVENGIILTNPHRLVEAGRIYHEILERMGRVTSCSGEGSLRTREREKRISAFVIETVSYATEVVPILSQIASNHHLCSAVLTLAIATRMVAKNLQTKERWPWGGKESEMKAVLEWLATLHLEVVTWSVYTGVRGPRFSTLDLEVAVCEEVVACLSWVKTSKCSELGLDAIDLWSAVREQNPERYIAVLTKLFPEHLRRLLYDELSASVDTATMRAYGDVVDGCLPKQGKCALWCKASKNMFSSDGTKTTMWYSWQTRLAKELLAAAPELLGKPASTM